MTIDAEGDIYTDEADGWLHWRAYDAATGLWTHRQIGVHWDQFDLIVAGGRGVLYARRPDGVLFRYQYDAASQRWLIVGQQVGAGWSIYDRVLSSGGDVLYG